MRNTTIKDSIKQTWETQQLKTPFIKKKQWCIFYVCIDVFVCLFIYLFIYVFIFPHSYRQMPGIWYIYIYIYIRVRDSRTGYLVPVRVALWDLPGWMCCWHVVVVVAAAAVGVILYFQEFTKISSQEKRYGSIETSS